jgi:hypothetical protein
MLHPIVLVRTDVSEERIASIFRVDIRERVTSMIRWLFLQNVDSQKNYTAQHPRKRHFSFVVSFPMLAMYRLCNVEMSCGTRLAVNRPASVRTVAPSIVVVCC